VRRYAPIKARLGTRWPPGVVTEAIALHRGRCLGAIVGMPGECAGQLEPDHIRASGAIGMKSRSTLDNCAPMCGVHHRLKTGEGRKWRPKLVEAVEKALAGRPLIEDCGHVDPNPSCSGPCNRADPMQLRATGS
jgi:hypothetical protein